MSSSILSNGSETGSIEVENDNFTVEWIIKDFSSLPQGEGDFFFSPEFSTVNKRLNCNFAVYPQGDKQDDAGYVAIDLYVDILGTGENIQLNTEISILPSGITRKVEFPITHHVEYPCRKLIEKSKLLELCGSDDTVTIRWKVEIPWETRNKMRSMEQAVDSQGGRLSQAFRPLFKEAKFSDVTVIVGTQRFPAHKLVLAARSPVFSAMLENRGTKENLENEVKIEEMKPAVVESMLEFFYTDEVTNLEEQAHELLEAANKYDVGRLRIVCEKVLYEKLNTENAAEILIHSDLHNSHKLKELVMEYMDHHLSEIVKMESYKGIEENHPDLVNELMRSIAARRETKN